MIGIYLRGNEDALTFQEKLCLRAAKGIGEEFQIFKDRDKSVDDINKEGLNSLVEAVKNKKIKKVIASDITRIGREGDYVRDVYKTFEENKVEYIILNIAMKITDYPEFMGVILK